MTETDKIGSSISMILSAEKNDPFHISAYIYIYIYYIAKI